MQLSRMQTSILKDPRSILPTGYLDELVNRDESHIEEVYEHLYHFIRRIPIRLTTEELADFARSPVFRDLERTIQRITSKSENWNRRFYEIFLHIYSKAKQGNIGA